MSSVNSIGISRKRSAPHPNRLHSSGHYESLPNMKYEKSKKYRNSEDKGKKGGAPSDSLRLNPCWVQTACSWALAQTCSSCKNQKQSRSAASGWTSLGASFQPQ